MSKLDELIAELCPDGVEYRKLKDVTEMQRGTSLTKKNATEGIYPVISGGTEPAFYCDSYNRENETITVAGSGSAGYVQYWNEPIFVCDAFSIKGKEGNLTKYIYYCLSNMQDKIFATKTGGGIPHVYISSIENFVIPLPPLPVQQEIVRILDNFTELTAELTAELKARKKQYEYYRDLLLTMEDKPETKWMKLGEIADFRNGKGHEKAIAEDGKFIVVNSKFISTNGQVVKFTNQQISPLYIEDILIVMSDLPNGKALAKCFLVDENNRYTLNQRIGALRVKNKNIIDTKFLYYFLNRNRQLLKYDNGVDQTNLKKNEILSVNIPIIPLKEQKRIVAILDRFDALCNDLTTGLPAEIEARQKQYEYYRDKLLSFKEVTA
jgi:type I restriction enzyme S subunit